MILTAQSSGPVSHTETKSSDIGNCFCVKAVSDGDVMTRLECVTLDHHTYKSSKFYKKNVLVYWSKESDQLENKPWPKLPVPNACRLPKRIAVTFYHHPNLPEPPEMLKSLTVTLP